MPFIELSDFPWFIIYAQVNTVREAMKRSDFTGGSLFTESSPENDWKDAIELLTNGEESDRRSLSREQFLVIELLRSKVVDRDLIKIIYEHFKSFNPKHKKLLAKEEFIHHRTDQHLSMAPNAATTTPTTPTMDGEQQAGEADHDALQRSFAEKQRRSLKSFLNRVGLGPQSVSRNGYAAASGYQGALAASKGPHSQRMSIYARFIAFGVDSVKDYADPAICSARALEEDIGLSRKEQLLYHLSLRQEELRERLAEEARDERKLARKKAQEEHAQSPSQRKDIYLSRGQRGVSS